jgi:hypothetical protein
MLNPDSFVFTNWSVAAYEANHLLRPSASVGVLHWYVQTSGSWETDMPAVVVPVHHYGAPQLPAPAEVFLHIEIPHKGAFKN